MISQESVLNEIMSSTQKEYLEKIGQVHILTKHYLLLAEELSEDGVSFLQPLKEHRDAYDHLMRIFSLHLRKEHLESNFNASKYIEDNLKKAYGHEYRAFFDTADWLTYICRKFIRSSLSLNGKRTQYIDAYGKDDFEKVKAFINSVSKSIASFREKKDISDSINVLEEVKEYQKTLDQLIEIFDKVQSL